MKVTTKMEMESSTLVTDVGLRETASPCPVWRKRGVVVEHVVRTGGQEVSAVEET